MTLQLYLLRQLAAGFVFALGAICLMVVPAVAVQAIYKLGGVSVALVVRYLPLVIAELLPYLLPIAFLLGVVATYGRLAADREWTAIRMAGIHPVRTFLPGLGLAVVLAAGTYLVVSDVSPSLKFEKRTYHRMADRDAIKSLGFGRTEFQAGGFGVSAQRRRGNLFEEVIVEIPRRNEEGEPEESLLLVADSVHIEIPEDEDVLSARFRNARVLRGREEYYGASPTVRIPLQDVVQLDPRQRDRPKYLTTHELRGRIASGGLRPEERRAARFAIHERYAVAATYLVFLLLGIPTGLLLRSGTHLGALSAAMAYAFLYYVLSMRLGGELADAGVLGPAPAAWSTNALYLAAAAVLVRKVVVR